MVDLLNRIYQIIINIQYILIMLINIIKRKGFVKSFFVLFSIDCLPLALGRGDDNLGFSTRKEKKVAAGIPIGF